MNTIIYLPIVVLYRQTVPIRVSTTHAYDNVFVGPTAATIMNVKQTTFLGLRTLEIFFRLNNNNNLHTFLNLVILPSCGQTDGFIKI